MFAEWTPARALVAEILDENLGRIESWFSAWNVERARNAMASLNFSLMLLYFLWPALNDHDRAALGGRFLLTYTRVGIWYSALIAFPIRG